MEQNKLTATEAKIIKLVQSGWVFVTTIDSAWAEVSDSKSRRVVRVSPKVFWNLVNKKYIYQNAREHFQYTLTDTGKKYNTTKAKQP